MESKKDHVILTNGSQVTIGWKARPFELKKSLNWRGIILHFLIEDKAEPLGFSSTVKIVWGAERFRFGFGKYKYMAGSIGKPPKIRCSTHRLVIEYMAHERIFCLSETARQRDSPPVEQAFLLFETPGNILFDDPPSYIAEPDKTEGDRVTLFEFESESIHRNSYAYFEGDDFVVDEWEMGRIRYYEDERFITLGKEHLPSLFAAMEIEYPDRRGLLNAMLANFPGPQGFARYQQYLDSKNISYQVSTY